MKKINVLAVADPAVVSVVAEKEITDKFERKTGIKINMDVLPWAEYYENLMASFESYKYDIVMVAGHLWLYDFAKSGNIKEISDYTVQYDYKDILTTIREEIEIDGKKYLFPFFCDGHMLLYRKSFFKDGLQDTVSIDELVNLVSNSKVDNGNVFALKSHVSEIFQDILPYFRSEGVEPFDAEGNTYFNNPSGLKALEKYISLKKYCDSDVQNFGNEEVLDQLQKGKCKIGVTWSGQIGQVMNNECVNPDDIEFASLDTSWNVTWCFAINKFCTDDESAQIFLEYITGKDVDKRVGYYCGNPVRQSSFDAGMNDNNWYSKVLRMVNDAKPVAKSDKTGDMMGIIASEVYDVFVGKTESKTALENAERKCKDLS